MRLRETTVGNPIRGPRTTRATGCGNCPLYHILRLFGVSPEKAREWTFAGQEAAMLAGSMGFTVRAAGGVLAARAVAGQNPLAGTRYTQKVQAQMRQGDYHGFPREVDNFAGQGRVSTVQGGDGVTRTKVELEGSWRGREGRFVWLIEPDNSVNHRIFIPKKR